MVSSAVTGMVQPVTKVAGSVGSQSGQDNSGNVDFARIMNSSVRNDVTGNSSKQTNTYSAAPSDSLVSMGANNSNKNADIVTTNSTVKNVKTDNAVKENSNKMTQDVQNAVSDIKEKIKKTMNVSDEDIESAMEQLGIIAEDLLDMQKLTDLVVALSGNTDSLEFLTDADSVSMLNDILEYAKSVTDNLEDVYNMDIDSIKEMPAIQATRQAYKKCGKDPSRYRPSSEALCRRLLRGLSLYQIDTLVDLINLASVNSGHSIGGFDRDKIQGDKLVLGIGKAGEPYEGIGRGELNIEGMPVYRDAVGGVGTPTSDNERTKISSETTHLLAIMNAYSGSDGLEEAVNYMVNLLKEFADAQDVELYYFE